MPGICPKRPVDAPLVELIETFRMAVEELIDVLGRGASIEAVLQLSAAGVAGEKHQAGKVSFLIASYG